MRASLRTKNPTGLYCDDTYGVTGTDHDDRVCYSRVKGTRRPYFIILALNQRGWAVSEAVIPNPSVVMKVSFPAWFRLFLGNANFSRQEIVKHYPKVYLLSFYCTLSTGPKVALK